LQRVFLIVLAVKLYGLAVLYLLFLRTPARPQIEESFLFLEPGRNREERVEEIEAGFWHRLGPFDGQWYLDIAGNGYRRLRPSESTRRGLPPGNYAFFPLFPVVIRSARAVAPGLHGPLTVALLIVLSAAGVAAAWRLARESGFPPGILVALLLAFPSAVFHYFLYTEALFLCLCGLALLSAIRGERARSALLGFLCGLARPQGVLLALPFAWEFLWRARGQGARPFIAGAGVSIAPFSGFAAMAAISAQVTGSPLGFLSVQSVWGRSTGFGGLLGSAGDFLAFKGPPFDLVAALLAVGLLPCLWRRLPFSLALYGTGVVLLPLSTGSLLSFGRFLSVSIPHFLCLASLLQGRPRLAWGVLFIFIALQVLLGKALLGWFFVG
jgi:hypothetical protein